MREIIVILCTMLPVILGGFSNMIFVKTKACDFLKVPIDRRIILLDGERLFGDNKTWKGFFGMILFSSISMLVIGIFTRNIEGANNYFLYNFSNFEFPFEVLLYGALLGFGYIVFELPNSFIKRRLRINPGTNAKGLLGITFALIDQADSVIGCLLVLTMLHKFTIKEIVLFILTGIIVHYLINVILYFLKLKKQAA